MCVCVQTARYDILDEMCACAYYVDHAIEQVGLLMLQHTAARVSKSYTSSNFTRAETPQHGLGLSSGTSCPAMP